MKLIVGLGNPGAKYAGHRHNVGFMIVDELASRLRADAFREKFSGVYAKAGEALLLKPQTYMNLSGESVQKAQQFFKLGLADLVVIHDELDLPFGTLKIKVGGGSAGHNGIKSVTQHAGGPDFARLRVGIGRPPQRGVEHVLSDFSRQECSELPAVLERAARAVTDILERGVQAAMNVHNQDPKK
ncbi:MAG TPA: aminoacyl-tRNA hydrolase [Polyangiales bacterium]|nr:aminoacyl-tRNA hydrolase [Polyangiales bacterium]